MDMEDQRMAVMNYGIIKEIINVCKEHFGTQMFYLEFIKVKKFKYTEMLYT
jgi:hypothetical protein